MKKTKGLWLCVLFGILLLGAVPKAWCAEIADYPNVVPSVSVTHAIVGVGADEGSVCITWLSASDAPELLLLTPAAAGERSTHASSLCLVSPMECVYKGLWRFTAQVTGLTPGTEYQYCIGPVGQLGHWSYVRRFQLRSCEPLEFLVLGDPQLRGGEERLVDQESFAQTLRAAGRAAPDAAFALYLGDLKQTKLLGSREERKEARKEYSSLKQVLSATGLPAAIVCGNHDVEEEESVFVSEFSAPVGRWQNQPVLDYAFQAGQTLFLVINTNHTSTWEHISFLTGALEEHPDARWRVLVMHHTLHPMSSEKDAKTLSSLRKRLTQVCCEMEIDVVFSAHNHFYARTNPLDEAGECAEKGPVYVSLNTSSGSIYLDPWKKALPEQRNTIKECIQENRPNYTRCRVDEHVFQIETFDAHTGECVDAVELSK